MAEPDPLASFHPLVRQWFYQQYKEPTPVQAAAWPRIARGENVLAVAPTGNGKTLAAFLDALSRLVWGALPPSSAAAFPAAAAALTQSSPPAAAARGAAAAAHPGSGFEPGRLSVLYVSPLKALNEDIRRNLEQPLGGIRALASAQGITLPELRVDLRSGDSSEAERRRFLSRPPAILCTTPESLAILLDSPRARLVLSGLRLLVLDEIHSVLGTKRGSLLACSVGRLELLAGGFQRLALSATVNPPELAARFVGGLIMESGPDGGPVYRERPFSIVVAPGERKIELSVCWPQAPSTAEALRGASVAAVSGKSGAADADSGQGGPAALPRAAGPAGRLSLEESRYSAIIPALEGRLREAGALLVFTDSRRRAERMAYLINQYAGEGSAYAHHGSLAKEARRLVEERFKSGELKCVVATSSLELGIDVGSVQEVDLAGTPPAVSTAIQRIGRAGHSWGGVSKAVLYPFHGIDLLLAAAMAQSVDRRDIENSRPPLNPLDILAQVMLEMIAVQNWTSTDLFNTIRSFFPFETLSRSDFDSVQAMLTGSFALPAAEGAKRAGMRLRELEPRVYLDAETGLLSALPGLRQMLYSSGGSIPDRGHFLLREAGSKSAIGELDEEFVWERRPGDSFTLGLQAWKIVSIGANEVEVVPLRGSDELIPFWRAEERSRSSTLSGSLLDIFDRLAGLPASARVRFFEQECHFDQSAASEASCFLGSELDASNGLLPGRNCIAVEQCLDPEGRQGSFYFIIHTMRGGAVNEPLALALEEAAAEAGLPLRETVANENSILTAFDCDGGPEAARTALKDTIMSIAPDLSGPDRSDSGVSAAAIRLEQSLAERLRSSGLFGSQFRENAVRALLIQRGMPGRRIPLWVSRLRARKLFEAAGGSAGFPITKETYRSCLCDFYDLEGLASLLGGLRSGRISLGFFNTAHPSPFAAESFWQREAGHMYDGDEVEGRRAARSAGREGEDIIAEALRSASLRPRFNPSLVADFCRKSERLLPGWAPSTRLELLEWLKECVFIPVAELRQLLLLSDSSLQDEYAADASLGKRLCILTLPGAAEAIAVHSERREELLADPGAAVPEWLRHRGPENVARIASLFGLQPSSADSLFSEYEEEGLTVRGSFSAENADEVIDAENLEILLRLSRKRAVWNGGTEPVSRLFGLVSELQGTAHAEKGAGTLSASSRRDTLAAALDSLSGFVLPPALWESEILPRRVPGFQSGDLDAILRIEERLWFGAPKGRTGFCSAGDLECLGLLGPEEGRASSLIPQGTDTMSFWEIRESSGLSSKAAALAIWKEAFAGRIAALGFEAVRSGISNRFGRSLPGFGPDDDGGPAFFDDRAARRGTALMQRLPPALRKAWQSGAPVEGRWFSLSSGTELRGSDIIYNYELIEDRVRILASRWGLVCRALLERELPVFSWSAVFPALRRLELRGELVYGRFFDGIDGPQFMSQEAFALFSRGLECCGCYAVEEPVWFNALDPVLDPLYIAQGGQQGRDGAGLRLPLRVPGSRIALIRGRPVACSSAGFSRIELVPGPDSQEALAVFRSIGPLKSALKVSRLSVESVNSLPALGSPYLGAMEKAGFERAYRTVVLWGGGPAEASGPAEV